MVERSLLLLVSKTNNPGSGLFRRPRSNLWKKPTCWQENANNDL
jgi:hypothetical protein